MQPFTTSLWTEKRCRQNLFLSFFVEDATNCCTWSLNFVLFYKLSITSNHLSQLHVPRCVMKLVRGNNACHSCANALLLCTPCCDAILHTGRFPDGQSPTDHTCQVTDGHRRRRRQGRVCWAGMLAWKHVHRWDWQIAAADWRSVTMRVWSRVFWVSI